MSRYLSQALGLALCTVGSAASSDDFYKGKQIRLHIPTPAGGSYDAFARSVAMHMPNHIPGRPSIISVNMPGATGVKLANYVYNVAPRDGTVIGAGYAGLPTTPLLAPEGVQFDLNKFSWIGNLTKEPYVGMVWHTSPIQTFEEMKSKETIFGGSAIGAAGTDFAIIAKQLFGFKLKIVTGYANSPDMKLAMERGELDGVFATGWSALNITEPTWVKEGKVRILVQHAFKRHRDIPDAPLFIDQAKNADDRAVMELMLARQESAKPYFGPPGLPADRLAILRAAFDATVRDPNFLADVKRQRLDIDSPMTGDEIADFTFKLSQTPPTVVKRIEQIFKDFQNSN